MQIVQFARQTCRHAADAARNRHTLRRSTLIMVVAMSLLVGLLTATPVMADSRILVPMIIGSTKPVGGSGDEPVVCALNEQEQAVLAAMKAHPDQRRTTIACNPILAEVARARAKDMAERNYFGHTNPDGNGPNYLVRQAGYPLPAWYGTARDANNIESIAAGYRSPTDAWTGWMASTGHKTHLLGLHSFYAAQTEVGIGYYHLPGSQYGSYWVVLSAPPADAQTVQELP